MSDLVFDNINPSIEELREFAYNPDYGIEQDWDICVVDFEHRHLYLEFAIDENCPHQDLFLHLLYVLIGSLVYDVISSQMTCDLDTGQIIYLEPIVKAGDPLPKTVQDKIAIALSEFKRVENNEIKKLCRAIETQIIHSDRFDYDFWFNDAW